ncbi:MAG TPA: hypothetical protein VLG27_01845 [Candidatus Saccharimonadia bacterium]|nr:hypothetical protein [Candidatus Saccharimonadia bacterium]
MRLSRERVDPYPRNTRHRTNYGSPAKYPADESPNWSVEEKELIRQRRNLARHAIAVETIKQNADDPEAAGITGDVDLSKY